MRCGICRLSYRVNPNALNRCIALHTSGQCCHVGMILVDDDGREIVPVPWPNCVLMPALDDITQRWLPAEHSREAVGCTECPHDAVATVFIIERPGLTTTTLQCRYCGDARVIRSKVPT